MAAEHTLYHLGRSYTTYQERMTPTGCTAPENEFHRKILDLPTNAGSLVRTQAADQYL
ncbi:MAG TPA: hypothetical protein VN372_01515 [Methanospirillum sp.]|nr:hypothetical protein [Methanospirillum sp.]